jgi:hypothetical protein
MTGLMSTDPRVLAKAVADSIVVAGDPEARRACLLYGQYARPCLERVRDAATGHPDPVVAASAAALAAHPQDPARHRTLSAALAARGADDPDSAEVFAAAWEAESTNRLGHHLGARYETGADAVDSGELLAVAPAPGRADADAEIVVVPFRDRDTGGARLRNLLACLAALADQSYDRGRYRVTVVEADDEPRGRQAVEPRADRYVFAPKPGLFNKSWAVNVGVIETAGAAEAICVLDADVLVDRDFVARNAARFRRPGTSGHLTYRNVLNLGERATDAAIRTRVLAGAAEADTEDLRGFVLRRPPGVLPVGAHRGVPPHRRHGRAVRGLGRRGQRLRLPHGLPHRLRQLRRRAAAPGTPAGPRDQGERGTVQRPHPHAELAPRHTHRPRRPIRNRKVK